MTNYQNNCEIDKATDFKKQLRKIIDYENVLHSCWTFKDNFKKKNKYIFYLPTTTSLGTQF